MRQKGVVYSVCTGALLQNGAPYIGSQWTTLSDGTGLTYNCNVSVNGTITTSNVTVSGTVTANTLAFTGALLQNGAPYIGSQWTTLPGAAGLAYVSNVALGSGQSVPTYGLAPLPTVAVAPTGLLAMFGFDASGNDPSLVATGAPQLVPGLVGQACVYLANEGNVLNGPTKAANTLVSTGSNAALTVFPASDVTVACWAMVSKKPFPTYTSAVWSFGSTSAVPPSSNACVLCYGSNGVTALDVALGASGQLVVDAYVTSNAVTSNYSTFAWAPSLTSNTWTHVVATLGAPPTSSNSLWVNGALVSTSSNYFGGALAAANRLVVGATLVGSNAFLGLVDEVRAYTLTFI